MTEMNSGPREPWVVQVESHDSAALAVRRLLEDGDPSDVDALNAALPELMGTAAVARAFGSKTSNLDRLAGVPPHAQRLDRGRVWRADVVHEAVRLRQKGRRK